MRISWRTDADALHLRDVAQSRKPSRRRTARLFHAGDRGLADSARALWPASPPIRGTYASGRAPELANRAYWTEGLDRHTGMLRTRVPGIRDTDQLSDPRGHRARAPGRF